jgi:probable selenium-dependent hydroxylase accessory protein YqeC
MLRLLHTLDIARVHAVALVGAGGKTTAMFELARLLAPAVVTTTTHLAGGQAVLANRHAVWAEGVLDVPLNPEDHVDVILVTGPADPGEVRLTGLSDSMWAGLRRWCALHQRPLLVEADGSRQRPLKAPAPHEPAIPADVDTVIVFAGLLGLGQALDDEHVHRPTVFAQLSGAPLGEPVTLDALALVLMHPAGGRKNVPPGARCIACLAQADTPGLRTLGARLARAIRPAFDAVAVISSRGGYIDPTSRLR